MARRKSNESSVLSADQLLKKSLTGVQYLLNKNGMQGRIQGRTRNSRSSYNTRADYRRTDKTLVAHKDRLEDVKHIVENGSSFPAHQAVEIWDRTVIRPFSSSCRKAFYAGKSTYLLFLSRKTRTLPAANPLTLNRRSEIRADPWIFLRQTLSLVHHTDRGARRPAVRIRLGGDRRRQAFF